MNEITWDEMCDLLSLAAVYDQRTGGDEDVKGWLLVARSQGWTVATAQRALVEHYSQGADRPRVTPAAITDVIRDARRRAAETFVEPDPPETLPRDQYPAWKRARLAEHIDRVLNAWADGALMPVTPSAAAELTGGRCALEAGLNMTTCPSELREQVARDFQRIGRERPDRHRPAVALPRRMAGDPDRRAAARAELVGREATSLPEPAAADGEATS
jgi:hypothetical protein